MAHGSLAIVGTGITLLAQLSGQAEGWIRQADRVFFLIPHRLGEAWMRQLNPNAESLANAYTPNQDRSTVYEAMITKVLDALNTGLRICVAFYGHPNVFVTPTNELLRRAEAAGHSALVLPGISAEDCLFADLRFDPGQQGCQSYEASDFLLRPRRFDPYTPLILWQIGVIGHFQVVSAGMEYAPALAALQSRLLRYYPSHHELTVYEAAQLPTSQPLIATTPLYALHTFQLTPISTLYIPPLALPPLDQVLCATLGIDLAQIAVDVRKE